MSSKFKSVEGMLTSVDSLFTTQAERDDMLKPKVEEIELDLIDGFEGHPFSVKDDEDMQNLIWAGDALKIRPGYRSVWEFEGRVNGIFFFGKRLENFCFCT